MSRGPTSDRVTRWADNYRGIQEHAAPGRQAGLGRRQSGFDPQRLLDPKTIATIEDFELVARWVVEGFMHGLHTSPYVGFSTEFASHREYLPGDDLRHLNWNLYGRHDRLYVKQYDAETNVELQLVVDVSSSMTAATDGFSKMKYAGMLAASLAHLAMKQRDAVGLTLFSDRVRHNLKARSSHDHLLEILQTLVRNAEYLPSESAQVLHEVAELMPRRGLVCLISDCNFETEELFSALNHFRHFGHEVLVFQILDPLECNMDVDGSVRFRDMETGELINTQAHEIRDAFTAAVNEWIEDLGCGCLSRDIDHSVLVSETPLETALVDYFVKRSQMF